MASMLAVATLLLTTGARADENFRPLSIQGDEHPNDCASAGYAALRATLASFDLPDRDDAQMLVHLLLCEPASDTAVTALFAHTADRIRSGDEATGQSPSKTLQRRSRSRVERWLRTGGAWQTELLQLTDGGLQLDFMSNEACQSRFVLRRRRSGWRVTEANAACD